MAKSPRRANSCWLGNTSIELNSMTTALLPSTNLSNSFHILSGRPALSVEYVNSVLRVLYILQVLLPLIKDVKSVFTHTT